jgi:hypothetical protein
MGILNVLCKLYGRLGSPHGDWILMTSSPSTSHFILEQKLNTALTWEDFIKLYGTSESWNSLVSIAVGYRVDGQSLNSGKIFLFSTASRLALGPTQPPIQWVPGTLSTGVKQLGHEADHSPPFSFEVKNGGAIPPLLHVSSWHSA